MVATFESTTAPIAQIARYEVSDDLPAAVFQHFVAAGKPFQQQFDSAGAIALRDHIFAGGKFVHVECTRLDHVRFFRG
jgi:hypothetical protein